MSHLCTDRTQTLPRWWEVKPKVNSRSGRSMEKSICPQPVHPHVLLRRKAATKRVSHPGVETWKDGFVRSARFQYDSVVFNCFVTVLETTTSRSGKPRRHIILSEIAEDISIIIHNSNIIIHNSNFGPSENKHLELETSNQSNAYKYICTYFTTDSSITFSFSSKGDIRVNQNLDLAVLQTVWLRFHNYVASKLVRLNPAWSSQDELVYQETRRIVIACFQHITYNEWLPILIGKISDYHLSGLH